MTGRHHGDTAEQRTNPAEALGLAGNLDKVREILFGDTLRDLDERFLLLEDRLKHELNSLAAALASGRPYDAFAGEEDLRLRRLSEVVDAMGHRLTAMEAGVTRATDAVQAVQAAAAASRAETAAALDGLHTQLHELTRTVTAKQDRAALADMFARLAAHMAQPAPGHEE